jgi:hypothetical protein
MLQDKLNCRGWNVIKDDFIDLNKSLSSQEDILYDDMFQMVYIKGDYIIDVGWYGDSIETGCFHLCYY